MLSIPVIGNGDIHSAVEVKEKIESNYCDLVMIGRAAWNNPGIFSEVIGEKIQTKNEILQKYFENQLVGSAQTIHRLFGWKKQTIYESLGRLITNGVITNGIMVDGDDGKFYCLVH